MFKTISLMVVLIGALNSLPDQYWNQASQNQIQDQAKHFFLNQPAPLPAPVPLPVPVPAPAPVVIPAHPVVVQAGPFPIQAPTITNNGETIIETLVGGVPFNCIGRPTGHYRDSHFCDVFHACVYGQQRKTYACPFVGEAQYFDEITRKCEFVRNNPLGCASNAFYH